MKIIARSASLAVLSLVLIFPLVSSAQGRVQVGGSGQDGSFNVGIGSDGNYNVSARGDGFSISFGSGSGTGIGGVANNILDIINNILVPLLFAVSFIVFLWGVFKSYILSGGSEDGRSEGHQLIFWGIIGFVVMISLWGLVNVVANTFQLGGYSAPQTPTSY